jgi:hypothetical protein
MMNVIEMVRSTSTPVSAGHFLILLAGALRPAERGLGHEIPEGEQQKRGDRPDHQLPVRHGHFVTIALHDHDDLLQHRRHRLVAGPLRNLHEIHQEDRHADRGDQRRETERAAQGPVGQPFDGPAHERSQQHADDQDDEQRQKNRTDAEPCGKDERGNQRDEGRNHEHVAMGEVHHPDDAEDHRVADGDKPVDRSERDAVDQLLDEDFHASPSRLRRCHAGPGNDEVGVNASPVVDFLTSARTSRQRSAFSHRDLSRPKLSIILERGGRETIGEWTRKPRWQSGLPATRRRLRALGLWEMLAPRRPRFIERTRRWPGNLGILAIDASCGPRPCSDRRGGRGSLGRRARMGPVQSRGPAAPARGHSRFSHS